MFSAADKKKPIDKGSDEGQLRAASAAILRGKEEKNPKI